MSHSSKAALADAYVKHAHLAASTGASLLETHGQRILPAAGAAGWHGPNDIKTLEGLAGAYLWSELPQVNRLSLRFDPGHVGSQGQYDIVNGLVTLEHGQFFCVPNNPAIGWASISLMPSGGAPSRSYVIDGMVTDADWRIELMVLEKVGAQGPQLPAFSAVRLL